jgi:hypothetical protein
VASITTRDQDRLAPGLRLDDDPGDAVALHHRGHELAVQHAVDASLFDQPIGDQLEALAVDLVAQRLAFGHGGAHVARAVFEFASDTACLDCGLVAIPGKALDPHNGDVAAETAKAFDQTNLDPGPRCRKSCGKPPGAGPDHKHVRIVDDRRLPGGFGDDLHLVLNGMAIHTGCRRRLLPRDSRRHSRSADAVSASRPRRARPRFRSYPIVFHPRPCSVLVSR